MLTNPVIEIAYLVAAVLFIFGLKGMTHPKTAVRGNLLGAAGMTLAVVVALAVVGIQQGSYGMIVVGVAIGGLIGAVLAIRIEMTAMPQLVALFNGFGGLASVFVAGGALLMPENNRWDALLASGVSGLIGGVTFSGSLIAFGKLQELKVFKKPWSVPGQQPINGLLAILAIVVCVLLSQAFGGAGEGVNAGKAATLYSTSCAPGRAG